MQIAVRDARRCCARLHVHRASAADVFPIVEARPGPVRPVVAVVGCHREDVHVAVHDDAEPGAAMAIEVADDVGEVGLGS